MAVLHWAEPRGAQHGMVRVQPNHKRQRLKIYHQLYIENSTAIVLIAKGVYQSISRCGRIVTYSVTVECKMESAGLSPATFGRCSWGKSGMVQC